MRHPDADHAAGSRAATPRAVLVTGAAGYVGGTVVRDLLADPATTVIAVDSCRMPHGDAGVRDILDHDRFELVREDIRNTKALEPFIQRADAVVHLAAIVGEPACNADPELARTVNLDASLALARASADAGIGHFVFVSTCSNYGIADPTSFADEDHPLNPISVYAETKVAVEQALTGMPDLPSTRLRLATVYGVAPRMRFDLTVNQFALEALQQGRLSIYGEEHWRPYVHVRDVARAICTMLDNPTRTIGKVFNVGSTDENYTKRMMYELLRARLPELEAEWVGSGPDPRSYRVSFERLRDELSFEVANRVPSGMDEIIAATRAGAFSDPGSAIYRNL